ncbi:hypothetical protein DYB32_005046 [Aphanomyces invadans]|uniref:Fungal lipase-type domain-containing protein n=1 Tax=Aphanomyces invadans TaxID=157072 RepID=A0A3R6YYT2_9STRA|nr:hypothetical protein DYB32_005046 [Aphanomyces invadans]
MPCPHCRAPAMHVSELVVRAVLVAATIAFLPWWSYQTFQGSSGARPIHTRVLWLGLVLVLYQNPIFMLAQWFRTVDDGTRLAANLCQTISTTCVRLAWLFLMDHPLSASSAWWKVVYGVVHVAMSLCMCVLRFPLLFSIAQHESTFVLLGFAMIFLTWTWLFWLRSICLRTMATLNDKLMYMTSRDQQLSYRFLFLELVLVIVYVGMSSIAQVVSLVREWILYGTAPFVLAAVSSFSGTGAGQVVPVEQILFVSMVVYMTMVVHLPPVESATSTARFYIEEAHYASARNPRLSHFGHRHPSQYDDSALFCLETAEWLVQLAWQAYMDPLGNPSASGNGVQALETFGFELIVHLRHELLDTQAIVCMHRTRKRLVVAFRGSAYAAVRSDLKETLRLLLDEHPDLSLYVTGHSMGGALAVLAAYDCAVHFNIAITMYNFGAPRVGNPAFVRQYNRAVPNSHRVVLDGDLWGLYEHVGSEIALDEGGNVIVDPSFIERRLHQRSKTRVAVHGMLVYRSVLRKCFDNLQL